MHTQPSQQASEIEILRQRLGELEQENARLTDKVAALTQTAQKYEDFYERSPDMYVSVDSETATILRCNETLTTKLGYTKTELIGRPIFDMYHPDCMAEVQQAFQSFVITGKVENAELQLRRKDGSKLDVSLSVSAVSDDDGNVLYSRSVCRDITKRKTAETALAQERNNLERLVQERTRELTQAHEDLQQELAEHKAAKEALLASEQRFYLAVQGSSVGLWDWLDVEQDAEWWSPRFYELLGYGHEEIEPSLATFAAMLHPDDKERTFALVEAHFADSTPFDIEYRLRTKSGAYRWFHGRGAVSRDAAGTPTRMVGSISDIHERKEAAEKLKHQEELYRTLTEAIPHVIWLGEADGQVSYQNRAYEALTGRPLSETLGLGWTSDLHPDDYEPFLQAYQVAYAQGRDDRRECRFRAKDGSYRTISYIGTPITDEEGTVTRWVGINTDVTELRQGEELFRAVFNSTSAGLLLVDAEGQILLANSGALEIFGYTEADLLDHSVTALIPQRFRAQHPHFLQAFFNQPTTRAMGKGRDLWGLRKDGSEFPIEVGLNPTYWNGQHLVLASIVDITERKAAEATLEEYAQNLERINEELELFAHVTSHDLQEPLRTIHSFVQVLEEDYGDRFDGEAQQYMAFITDATERMRALIQALLSYSRAGKQSLSMEAVNFEELLHHVLMGLQFSIDENQGQITHDPLPTVQGNPMQLALVLQNLISNALKFKSEATPHIHISALQEADTWRIAIRDNGIGIKERFRDRIFGVFKRLHSQADYPGTGIGLAICKKIVERHGGTIGVASEFGKGSTFYFTLPN